MGRVRLRARRAHPQRSLAASASPCRAAFRSGEVSGDLSATFPGSVSPPSSPRYQLPDQSDEPLPHPRFSQVRSWVLAKNLGQGCAEPQQAPTGSTAGAIATWCGGTRGATSRGVGVVSAPCGFLEPLAAWERRARLSFFFRGSLVNLEAGSLSLSSSPFSSFFFLTFFTPAHFKRCPRCGGPPVQDGGPHFPPFPPISPELWGICAHPVPGLEAPLHPLPHSASSPAAAVVWPRAPAQAPASSSSASALTDGAAEVVPALNTLSLCQATPAHSALGLFQKYSRASLA